MKNLTITILPNELQANYMSIHNCPLALAIKRQLGESVREVYVGGYDVDIYFRDGSEEFYIFDSDKWNPDICKEVNILGKPYEVHLTKI